MRTANRTLFDRLLSPAAHDMRGALTNIGGFAELMLLQDYDADQRRKMLASMRDQAEKLGQIVDELLELARLELSGQADPPTAVVSLAPLLRAAVAELTALRPSARVMLDIDERAPAAAVDAMEITRAMVRLLLYGTMLTGDGQMGLRLAREVDESDQPGANDRGAGRGADRGAGVSVSLVVRDLEIPVETLHRDFAPFARCIDRAGRSRDTGLATVQAIVARHAGRLTMTNLLPGVAVTVTLPGAA